MFEPSATFEMSWFKLLPTFHGNIVLNESLIFVKTKVASNGQIKFQLKKETKTGSHITDLAITKKVMVFPAIAFKLIVTDGKKSGKGLSSC